MRVAADVAKQGGSARRQQGNYGQFDCLLNERWIKMINDGELRNGEERK